jgi:Fur family transcriptional regulator, ferric uptake regulator
VTWEERTHEALRDAGHRVGGARRAVVAVLAGRNCCLTVPEIVDAVRAHGRTVGIASAYRVVDLLTEKHLVQKVDLGDGRARYERVELADEHHHHLVCNECGRVEPFADETLEAALRRVEHDAGFAVASHDVLLRGACDDCRDAA